MNPFTLTLWVCLNTAPMCLPAADPTGPPVIETTDSYLTCEYKWAGMLYHITPAQAAASILVPRHTCKAGEPTGDPT